MAEVAPMDAAIAGWDDHVARCPSCLAFGTFLCAEGESLAEDVEIARESAPAPDPVPGRSRFPSLLRPILPGVTA